MRNVHTRDCFKLKKKRRRKKKKKKKKKKKIKCGSCGKGNRQSVRFCVQCGSPMR